jgi:lipoprotein-anchoring transpeptidase ErfK/SrfK
VYVFVSDERVNSEGPVVLFSFLPSFFSVLPFSAAPSWQEMTVLRSAMPEPRALKALGCDFRLPFFFFPLTFRRMLLLLAVVSLVAAQTAGFDVCPRGTALSQCVVVLGKPSAENLGTSIVGPSVWCAPAAGATSFTRSTGVDFDSVTSDEVVRVEATVREQTSMTSAQATLSRYGVYVRQQTQSVTLVDGSVTVKRLAHAVCVASDFAVTPEKRAAIIAAAKFVKSQGLSGQEVIGPVFRCVVDANGVTASCGRPAAPPAPGDAVEPIPSNFATGKYIRVYMSRFLVEVFENGQIVRRITRMAFGREGHRTTPIASGRLSPTKRDKNHMSTLYHALMPYALFFDHDLSEAFHQGSIDTASHGCIHLEMIDAKWLFEWAKMDPVGLTILGPYPVPAANCEARGLKFDGTSKCI